MRRRRCRAPPRKDRGSGRRGRQARAFPGPAGHSATASWHRLLYQFGKGRLQRKAAIDHMNGAGGERALVAGEIDGQRRHLLGRAEASPPASRAPWAAIRSSSEGVAIVPGQIALQRMPWAMKSIATDLVRPITAALVEP